ncbi:MAG: hypothetical protein HC902_03810 [Calothrix sp. SM1_5_4]|nr:hypothetical protein [Calothrix sp. SM1_5_4]
MKKMLFGSLLGALLTVSVTVAAHSPAPVAEADVNTAAGSVDEQNCVSGVCPGPVHQTLATSNRAEDLAAVDRILGSSKPGATPATGSGTTVREKEN